MNVNRGTKDCHKSVDVEKIIRPSSQIDAVSNKHSIDSHHKKNVQGHNTRSSGSKAFIDTAANAKTRKPNDGHTYVDPTKQNGTQAGAPSRSSVTSAVSSCQGSLLKRHDVDRLQHSSKNVLSLAPPRELVSPSTTTKEEDRKVKSYSDQNSYAKTGKLEYAASRFPPGWTGSSFPCDSPPNNADHDTPGAFALGPSGVNRLSPISSFNPQATHSTHSWEDQELARENVTIPSPDVQRNPRDNNVSHGHNQFVADEFIAVEAHRVEIDDGLERNFTPLDVPSEITWYKQRGFKRLCAGCVVCIVILIVVVVVLMLQQLQPKPTPEEIACTFLSRPSLQECHGNARFDATPETGDDSVTGTTIPSEIGLLTHLTYLNLYGNKLTGSIPSSIKSLTLLKFLSVSQNRIGGTIPSSMSRLVMLTHLDFRTNRLTGNIPEAFSDLTSLRVLDFKDNQLTGTIPSSFSALTNLSTLNFQGNSLGGDIPDDLCTDGRNISIDCDKFNCSESCCIDESGYCLTRAEIGQG